MSPPAYSTPSSWGVLAYLGMLVLKVKYAPLLGAWYRLNNTIPFLGPLPGRHPAVLVTAFDSPLKALYLGIYIIVMQQIDAWFIDPMITSNRLQISPLWVLLGVTVGGGFFGVWGMFFGRAGLCCRAVDDAALCAAAGPAAGAGRAAACPVGSRREPPHRKRRKRHPQAMRPARPLRMGAPRAKQRRKRPEKSGRRKPSAFVYSREKCRIARTNFMTFPDGPMGCAGL